MRAAIERFLSPGLSSCYRCRRPWKFPKQKRIGLRTYQQLHRDRFYGLVGVESHTTNYKDGRGCFPLCEGCWAALSPEERLPYYRQLVVEWIRQLPEERDQYEQDAPLIYEAVLAGK